MAVGYGLTEWQKNSGGRLFVTYCVRFCITEGETGMYYVDNVMHSNNNSIVVWQDKL